MKNRIFSLLLILCLLLTLFPSAAFATEITAEGTCGDNLTWVLTDDGTLTISGNGPMPDFTSVNNVPWYQYVSSIIRIVVEPGITTIGDYALCGYGGAVSISLPEGITSIGYGGISECYRLTEITLPEGLESIGACAFLCNVSLTELEIPDSVSFIGNDAFSECEGLLSIAVPEGVTEIGERTFAWCSSLAEVTLPSTLTTIGDNAFMSCRNLSKITIPDGVVTIGASAITQCYSLTEVIIPDSVTSIGEAAFRLCKNLTTVSIPASVTSIGTAAFALCTSVTGYQVDENNPNYANNEDGFLCSKDGTTLIQAPGNITSYSIPETVTAIDYGVFYGHNDLIQVEIPESVTSIGDWAFSSCNGLTSVVIPNSVTSLGQYAFAYCENLSNVTLSENMTTIDVRALRECPKLTWIRIPASITSIKYGAFDGCTGLTRIYFQGDAPAFDQPRTFGSVTATCYYPAGNTTWTDDVMQDYDGTLTWVPHNPLSITTQPESVTVAEGENAIVTVEAQGDGLTYEWYYSDNGGAKFHKTSAFTGNTYKVPMTDARNGRLLYCVITDANGNSVATDVVTIRMDTAVILTQPQSVTVAEGENAIVTVEASGAGLTYEWYYSSNGGAKFHKTSAFTGNTYKVPMTDARDGRMLYCVITDRYGNSVTTDVVTICMEHHAQIITQPKSVTVAEGEYAVVTVEAAGDGLIYEWYYSSNGVKYYKTTAFTGNTYKVPMTDARNGRMLYCVITDRYGNSVKTDTVAISMR